MGSKAAALWSSLLLLNREALVVALDGSGPMILCCLALALGCFGAFVSTSDGMKFSLSFFLVRPVAQKLNKLC